MRIWTAFLLIASFALGELTADSCCFEDVAHNLSYSMDHSDSPSQDHHTTDCLSCVRCVTAQVVPQPSSPELKHFLDSVLRFAKYEPLHAPSPDLNGLLRPPIA